MKWLLLLLLLVAVLIAGALAAVLGVGGTRFFLRRRQPSWDRARPQPRCLQCRGTGWTNREPERTLNFVGDGFEDRHAPATICRTCGGTGIPPRR